MIITLVRTELARLTSSKMGILSLVALMTVPLVYGGLYLWGNQDPYSRLDQIPAALVVDDTGATNDDGEAVNYGQDAADELLDGMDFGWVEVSAAQAKAGIVSGKYDFGLTFPKNFSTDLVSAGGDDPTAAKLALTTSDTNSYLSSTLAERAAEAVRVKVAEQLGEEAAGTLLDSLEQVREGLIDAADGAKQLSDGAATAATGASTLAEGAASAASGAASLSTGNASLSSGASKLSSGLTQLDKSAAALPSATATLATGAASVASGASQAATGEAALLTPAAQASQLSAAVQTEATAAFADGIVTPDESQSIQTKLGQVAALTAGVSSGVTKIAPGLTTLSSGAAQVSAGTNTLNAQAPVLANAVHTAATGAATLASGAKSAASGASSLATGTAQLSTGATDLSTGVASLASGSSELSTSLGDAVVKIPGSTDAERSKAAAAIADPVLVKRTSLTEAENYGAGLAPFFITLAAWIGMYALFLLVRPLSRRALTAVRRPVRTALAGWLTPALLGVLQVAALFAIVTFGLGMDSANPLALLGFLAFISITFASIILALNVWLGSVGQFIGLILMVVQLVTAGGTFPWQTLPAPLAFIHQGLPMSHAVDGVRQLMYGGSPAAFWATVLPLAAWLLISLAASALGALKQGRFRTLRELRPSPIGA
ncbi:YhgE/Pip domain-containing protein [Conyzicola nivalis]|uniref:ABC transporter n=1 Tax=Conyzicola nivalis TaxID=1477021 RepID=A0A916SNX6_9MICO|nr:YhgE/Pip family protein [Conyzicola nivalis]GGB09514.1 ABC transporter [Conyzicola nivalis]